MTSIKNELVGSWQLLSYIEISADGSDSFFPLGNHPNGILIYAADGYMSVQIMEVKNDKSDLIDDNTVVSQNNQLLVDHIARNLFFSGSYHIDSRNAIVTHHVMTSATPRLIGKEVIRNVTFENDILYLKSIRPVLSNGKLVNSYMTWQRLEKFEMNVRKDKILQLGSKNMKMI